MPARDGVAGELAERMAFWAVDGGSARAVIAAAADAVAEGFVDESIVRLASRYADDDSFTLTEDVADVLRHLGRADIVLDEDVRQLTAGRFICHEWLRGRLGTTSLLRWFHDRQGHLGAHATQIVLGLDDEFASYGSAMPTAVDEILRVREAVLGYLEATKAMRP